MVDARLLETKATLGDDRTGAGGLWWNPPGWTQPAPLSLRPASIELEKMISDVVPQNERKT